MLKSTTAAIALSLWALILLSGCEKTDLSGSESEPAAVASAFKRYPASLFHETTTFRLSHQQGYGFSRDDGSVLLSSDLSGIFNAHRIDTLSREIAPVTESTDSALHARSFFPADDRVIVEGDQGGNELDHIYIRELDGSLHDLTPGENLKARFIRWRKDGRVFYYASNERDPKADDVYGVIAVNYERRLLFRNDGSYSVRAISPNGFWLALVKQHSSANSDLYIADLRNIDTPPKLISAHDGDVKHEVFTFTADNRKLIYATDEHGEFTQAWTYDLVNEKDTVLIDAEWDVANVMLSPSGRYRISSINADGLTVTEIIDTASGEPVALHDVPEGEMTQIRFNRKETHIAFGVNTDTSPVNVYVSELLTGETSRLTGALPEELDEAHLVTAGVVRYPSFDGLEIPGIFYLPQQASAAQPVPALVWVHGGPGGQSTRGYSAMIQHLVNHGYAVLAANNRGSSGYGKTFFHLDDRKHGEDDLMDIVYARRYLKSLEQIDGDRIGIIGGSYGGYMAVAALTFHPGVFDVGVDIFGVTNWARTLSSIPEWWGAFRVALYDEMGDPATDAERHHRISPLFHAARITRPLYVVQGANDPRVLQVESDELVAAVRANDVPVEYVLFPDEGHGFEKRENRITNSERIVKFLDRYLKCAEQQHVER